jgi:hypothetical protein
MTAFLHRSILLALAASISGIASAQGTDSTAWTWRATLYGWFPSIHSSTQALDSSGGGITSEVNPDSYLSHLKFTFMGALEARNGPWSFIGDAIYLNFGNLTTRLKSISGPGGNVTLPLQANLNTDLKGFVGTLAAGYTVARAPGYYTDVIGGLRYTDVKTSLEWEFSGPAGPLTQRGSADASKSFTDAIVGVRGRVPLGSNWFVPYYADIGAGSSRFTWQAFGGIGYAFAWGDATLVFRHLAYDFKSDHPMSDLSFSGPAIGVSFRF